MKSMNAFQVQHFQLFVLIGNRPIIGRLFGTDYRPTDNPPVHCWCIPTTTTTTTIKTTTTCAISLESKQTPKSFIGNYSIRSWRSDAINY